MSDQGKTLSDFWCRLLGNWIIQSRLFESHVKKKKKLCVKCATQSERCWQLRDELTVRKCLRRGHLTSKCISWRIYSHWHRCSCWDHNVRSKSCMFLTGGPRGPSAVPTCVVFISLRSTCEQLSHGGAHWLWGAAQILSTLLQLQQRESKEKQNNSFTRKQLKSKY